MATRVWAPETCGRASSNLNLNSNQFINFILTLSAFAAKGSLIAWSLPRPPELDPEFYFVYYILCRRSR